MSVNRVASSAELFRILTRSKKKVTIEDLRLPWKPLYDLLSGDLFYSRRQFEIRSSTRFLLVSQLTICATAKFQCTWPTWQKTRDDSSIQPP